MNKGFPTGVGTWNIYATIPATRTNAKSTAFYEGIEIIPQGTKTPDYGNKNYKLPDAEPGYDNYAFDVQGEDIVELYGEQYVGYAVFEVDGHTECWDVYVDRYGEEPFTYYIGVDIPMAFAYTGTAKIHLNSTGENGLKSTNIYVSGNWYKGVA